MTSDMVPRPVVLVVDDEPMLQTVLRRVLQMHDFDPHTADCAAGAIELANTILFDAMILDLSLSGQRSGLDVLTWFRSQPAYGSLPILILTGEVNLSEEAQEVITREKAFLLHKPQPFAVLIGHLKRVTAHVGVQHAPAA